ncbi:22780_t:CDS:2, partial [Dentiscutata erythropus]
MTERDIPKIHADAKEDILYIQEEIKNAALKTVEKHFGSGADPQLGQTVATLVKKACWVNDTFELAAPNLEVNGFDYDKALKEKDDTEPLDENLRHKVQTLQAEIEEMTLLIAQNRKTLPDQAEILIRDLIKRQSMLVDDVELVNGKEEMEEDIESLDDMSSIRFVEQIHRKYDRNLSVLSDLKK